MYPVQDLCPIDSTTRPEHCERCVGQWGGTPPCVRQWLKLRTETMRLPEEPRAPAQQLPRAA